MNLTEDRRRALVNEANISYSCSGGPGGQNVNKRSTKACLRFDVDASKILNTSEKGVILARLGPAHLKDSLIVIAASEHRQQGQNREAAIARLFSLLEFALTPIAARIATKSTESAQERRRSEKERNAKKKNWRRSWDD